MEHFLKAVDEITVKDICSIAQKLLSSPLTMASYGDGNFPVLLEISLFPLFFFVFIRTFSAFVFCFFIFFILYCLCFQ